MDRPATTSATTATTPTTPVPYAITGAAVFDGERLLAPCAVLVEAGRIAAVGSAPAGVPVIDGRGATLLPGLVDAHVHLSARDQLDRLVGHGVTTALDMGVPSAAIVDVLRGRSGTADLRSATVPGVGPGARMAGVPGFPASAVLATAEQATTFVAQRVAEGADYLKIVLEARGPGAIEADVVAAFVTAAHTAGRLTVAHALAADAYALAYGAGIDVLTHVPLAGPPLEPHLVAALASDGRPVVPTLTMMANLVDRLPVPGLSYDLAEASVRELLAAGVLILAGTDANDIPGGPAPLPHGSSMPDELVRLVAAGLTPTQALRAATSAPAEVFGLTDRGVIEPGRRADLLLVDGDPTTDITAVRDVRAVWVAGTSVVGPE